MKSDVRGWGLGCRRGFHRKRKKPKEQSQRERRNGRSEKKVGGGTEGVKREVRKDKKGMGKRTRAEVEENKKLSKHIHKERAR